MIKRTYFVFAKCYSKESSSIFSQHWFGITFRSWIKPDYDKITTEALKNVVSKSYYAEGDSSRISIISINRI